jgi:hypothetical protein
MVLFKMWLSSNQMEELESTNLQSRAMNCIFTIRILVPHPTNKISGVVGLSAGNIA